MLVFRVETIYGKGAYAGCLAGELVDFFESSHPEPFNDGKLVESFREFYLSPSNFTENTDKYSNWEMKTPKENFYYGFSSMEQLKCWFYDDKKLAENVEKGKISVYKVPFILDGYTQCVFDMDLAEKIAELPLTASEYPAKIPVSQVNQ